MHLELKMNIASENKSNSNNQPRSAFKTGFFVYLTIHLLAVMMESSGGSFWGALGGCGILTQWFYMIPLTVFFMIRSMITKRGWTAVGGVLIGSALFWLIGMLIFVNSYNFP